MLYSFTATQNGIETTALGQRIIFKFLFPITTHDVSSFQKENISKINLLQNQINYLKEDLSLTRINERLQTKEFQEKLFK